MAITTVSGLVGTADPTSAELKVDMRDEIAMLDVETTQFTSMLMHPKLSSERARSFKVEWMSDQYLPHHTALNGSISNSVTAFNVTTNEGAYGRIGDVVRISNTGEAFRITATAASSWSGVRAQGSVAAASAIDGAKVVILSGSNEQGATLPTRLITSRVADYNLATAA